MVQPSVFQADEYEQFRLHYPAKIFHPLRSSLLSFRQPLRVLDLGAGTGFGAESFLSFFPDVELTLLEPDSEMLKVAKTRFQNKPVSLQTVLGSAEEAHFSDSKFDLILVGSAWHWMEGARVLEKLHSWLSERGLLYIFEYRFPKIVGEENSGLNEWVRRQFNLFWKAPLQTPRGTLYEITQRVRDDFRFFQKANLHFEETSEQAASHYLGMIFSQSRFLHYEASLSENEKQKHRIWVQGELMKKWGKHEELPLNYPFQGVLFQKRF